MKIINKFLIAIAGLTAFSCSNFLDVKPGHMLPLEGAIETIEDCDDYRIGLYASFKNPGGLAGLSVLASDVQCDYVLPVLSNGQSLAGETKWTFTSQDFSGASSWSAFYQTIMRANYLLEQLPKIVDKTNKALAVENIVPADKTKLLANLKKLEVMKSECHMARAYCHMELVKLFSNAYDPATAATELGLPYKTTFAVGAPPTRVKLAPYYDSVFKDLMLADSITNTKVDDIYFTKAALYMLKARAYLYTQQWDLATQSATKIIENTGYQLLSAVGEADALTTPFAKMWDTDKGNEIIWKIGFTSADEVVSSYASMFYALKDGNKMRPEFVMANGFIDDEHSAADARLEIFYRKATQTDYPHGLIATILAKFPGNAELNKSSASRYGNMPKVMRLAEVYLIRAEAYAMLGQAGPANEDLKALRRKRINNFDESVNYTGDELIAQIRLERKLELVMEGHRLYDLKRYKQGFERKRQDYVQTLPATLNIAADNPRFTWPIPSAEFDVPGASETMDKNPSNAF